MAHASEHRLVPDCRVSVGGKPLKLDEDAALARVDVDLHVDLFGQCVLTFHDPHLKLINGPLFASGVPVKLEIGFHTKMKKVFEGEVVALEPQFRRDLPPALKVVCLESLHRLALSQMTRAFNAVDDKQIVTKIAQERGLTGSAPTGTKEHILQSNVTDAAFLRRLAQKHGNHLRISGKNLILGPPPKGGTHAHAWGRHQEDQGPHQRQLAGQRGVGPRVGSEDQARDRRVRQGNRSHRRGRTETRRWGEAFARGARSRSA